MRRAAYLLTLWILALGHCGRVAYAQCAGCAPAAGTVATGTSGQFASYPATGATVSGNSHVTDDGTNINITGRNLAIGTTVSTTGQQIDVVCSGDITTAFQAAVNTLASANGGTVRLSSGSCYSTAQITIPNNGDTTSPAQVAIRFTGQAGSANGQFGPVTGMATQLDLRYSGATTGKIDTRGHGLLEIDHIGFIDSISGTTGCDPFIFTTNTTLSIHYNSFVGRIPFGSACNDGIILGGTSTGGSGQNLLATAPFQGFHTEIGNNFFSQMRQIVVWNQFANAVRVVGNTVAPDCGNSLMNGAAFYFAPYGAIGNYIAGNLIELSNYIYGVYCGTFCQGNSLLGNSTWDPGSGTLGAYYLTGGLWNIVTSSHDDPPSPLGSYVQFGPAFDLSNTVIGTQNSGAQNNISGIPAPAVMANYGSQIATTTTGIGTQFRALGPTPGVQLSNTGSGGVAVRMLSGWTNNHVLSFLNNSNVILFEIDITSGAVKIPAFAGGGKLPTCFDNAGNLYAGTNTAGVLACP